MIILTILGAIFAAFICVAIVASLATTNWSSIWKQMWCKHVWVPSYSRFGWLEWRGPDYCKHCHKQK